MRFHVIDPNTGKYPDVMKIALAWEEDWAKALVYCDMEGFAILEGGELVILDECGKYCFCSEGRFRVVMDDVL